MDWNEEKSLNLSERYICDYQEASRVIIAGGRDFDDYEYMSTKLNELLKKCYVKYEVRQRCFHITTRI